MPWSIRFACHWLKLLLVKRSPGVDDVSVRRTARLPVSDSISLQLGTPPSSLKSSSLSLCLHSLVGQPTTGTLAALILTLNISNVVFPAFPPKDCTFGVQTMSDVIQGKYAPRTPQKRREQAVWSQNAESYISQYLQNYYTKQLEIWGPSSDHKTHYVCGPLLIWSKPNTDDDRHIENRYDVFFPP